MVGTTLAALGAAMMLDAGMLAPPDDVGKLADAIAIARTCPYLRLDEDAISRTMARQGIRLAPLMPEIMTRSRAMEGRYILTKSREACRLGRQLYGASGSAAAGFLAER